MNPAIRSETYTLMPATSGFVLSAVFVTVFNTGLAWAKDLSPQLNNFMKSLSGHHWTTHGLADLILFVALGLIFSRTRLPEKIGPQRLTAALAGAVFFASLGLVFWYVFT